MYLYDENGEAQDKFRAKGNADAAGGPDHPFTVTSMAYSADNARLALAQSDGIVYVYKLGLEWRGKKSISNKFPVQARPVTAFTSDCNFQQPSSLGSTPHGRSLFSTPGFWM